MLVGTTLFNLLPDQRSAAGTLICAWTTNRHGGRRTQNDRRPQLKRCEPWRPALGASSSSDSGKSEAAGSDYPSPIAPAGLGPPPSCQGRSPEGVPPMSASSCTPPLGVLLYSKAGWYCGVLQSFGSPVRGDGRTAAIQQDGRVRVPRLSGLL